MIQSMTGFGKATAELSNKKITVEVKSLNSKQLDLSVRIPSVYKEQELNVRSLIARRLERGKVDFAIYIENTSKETTSQINQNVLEAYYNQIKNSSEKLGVAVPADWFQVLLRLPDVLKYEAQEADEEEWKVVSETINKALDQLVEFRKQEGKMLEDLFIQKVTNISTLMTDIEPFEAERVEKVKNRIIEALQKIENFDYDKNRFEQEMIYYIEKLDINEEKVRLRNHLKYFLETLNDTSGQGKKLGFITQEMGREINTTGSKANHVQMQQIVVQMKDELEQIKEQVLNVL
ncbi:MULTISPECIES: YicC/YloC family endoribonuclease [unclassified Dysgonomonas]|uniref:YicC/YloC family endoribonuclease n=1 Tax=unclassified Dysgonomonas TaxID=2630389 RepID=UPI0006824609|nr:MULTISPECIES: YicC/YloC family endoribonuclease [unclassified Dysgonomonas]MBD8347511.1 YicC family protein [Dysgonomonas sp. HGC4]MBF0577029.1 YicC family protein [Dysgonomonas sp. GY617]